MALSSCPKCENHSFELQELVPIGSGHKLMAVQCSSCGAIVGTMDGFNIGYKLGMLEAAVKEIGIRLGVYVDL